MNAIISNGDYTASVQLPVDRKQFAGALSYLGNCPYLFKCTESKNHVKVVSRHIWEEYMEICEDLRHTDGNKEIYDKRKETIERIFGTAKEFHGFRYTNMIGKARMEMKVGLTFACLNLKKLATILWKKRGDTISNTLLSPVFSIFSFFHNFLSLKRLKRC